MGATTIHVKTFDVVICILSFQRALCFSLLCLLWWPRVCGHVSRTVIQETKKSAPWQKQQFTLLQSFPLL